MTDPVTRTWKGEQVDIEEKTGQWLGATVASVTQKSSVRGYGDVLVGVTYFSNTRPRLIIISNSPSQDYTHPDDRTLLYKQKTLNTTSFS